MSPFHMIMGAQCPSLHWILVLAVPPSFRTVGAGCARLVQDPGCWLCSPAGCCRSPVPRCSVVGAECHPPLGAGCAPCTAPWVLDVLLAGWWVWVPPTWHSECQGCWVAPSEGFVGAVEHSQSHRGVHAHLSISPGHPWASLGACSCCTWEGKVFTWENQKNPSSASPPYRGFHLHQPWGSPGAHHGCSSQFLDTAGWAPGLSGAGELSPPGDSSTPESEAGAWHRSQIPNVAPQGSTGLALKPPEAGLGCLCPAGNPDLVLCILLRALTTVLPGTSRAPGLILAPDNCCTSSGAESQPGCIRGAPARGNASIPVGSGAGGQLWPSIPPAAPALLLPEPQPFGN